MKFRGVLLLIALSFLIPDRAEARIFGRMMSRIRQNGGMFRRRANQGGLFRQPQFVQPQFVQPQPQFNGNGNAGVQVLPPTIDHGVLTIPSTGQDRVVDGSPAPGDRYQKWWDLYKSAGELKLDVLASMANETVEGKPYKTKLVELTCAAKQGEPQLANLRIFSKKEGEKETPFIYLEPKKDPPTLPADAWTAAMLDSNGEKAGAVVEAGGGIIRNDNRWKAKNPDDVAKTKDFESYEVNLKKGTGGLVMQIVYKNSKDPGLDYKMYCRVPAPDSEIAVTKSGHIDPVNPFLKKNCASCHSPVSEDGELFDSEGRVLFSKLDNMINRAELGEMPPGSKTKATKEETAALRVWQEKIKQSFLEKAKNEELAKAKPSVPSDRPAASNPQTPASPKPTSGADFSNLKQATESHESYGYHSNQDRIDAVGKAWESISGPDSMGGMGNSMIGDATKMAEKLAIRQAMGTTKQTEKPIWLALESKKGANDIATVRESNLNGEHFGDASIPLNAFSDELQTKLKALIPELLSSKGKIPEKLSPIQVHELTETIAAKLKADSKFLSAREQGLIRDAVAEMMIAMHGMPSSVIPAVAETSPKPEVKETKVTEVPAKVEKLPKPDADPVIFGNKRFSEFKAAGQAVLSFAPSGDLSKLRELAAKRGIQLLPDIAAIQTVPIQLTEQVKPEDLQALLKDSGAFALEPMALPTK